MAIQSVIARANAPNADPRIEAQVVAARGFSTLLQTKPCPGSDLLTNIEGALTAVAVLAEHYKIRSDVADLFEAWVETLRSDAEVAIKVSGTA